MLNNKQTEKAVREALALGFSIDPSRRSLREFILQKFSTCAHCDRPSEHVALITPEHRGGTYEADNVRPMCSKHMIQNQLVEWFGNRSED